MIQAPVENPILSVFKEQKSAFPVLLAPMVGLSHVALRRVVRRYLPNGLTTLWPSEMLSSFRLPTQDIGRLPEAQKDADEKFWVPQILGNQLEPISRSVEMLVAHGAAGIDINMGCPVRKALKHNYGVALMGDPLYAADVVRMTKKSSQVPVSVKLRAGLQEDLIYLKDFIQGLQNAGADWITLHPRLAAEKRRGVARWEQIAWIKERVQIPVIGNGDIQTAEDALIMKEQTGCDAVMLGRALAAKPWILWQLGEKMGLAAPPIRARESAPQTPEEEGLEFGRVVKAVWEELQKLYPVGLAHRKFCFYLKHSAVWLEFGHELERVVSKNADGLSLQTMLEEFFKYPHRMSARTQLRQ